MFFAVCSLTLPRLSLQPKIIDAILYNGEPSLQLRLELLGDVVDEFLVVEAATTFSGLAKPFLYTDRHASVLEPYRHKLTVMIVDSFPEPPEDDLKRLLPRYWTSEDSVLSWFREQHQRDLIAPYVTDKYKDQPFVLLVCDADEIPQPHVVQHMRRSPELYHTLETPTALQMSMFFYNFKWLRDHPWMSAFAVNNRGLRAIHGQLSVTRQQPIQYIPAAGWHLSYFTNAIDIARKLKSFSHTEFSGDSYTDLAMVQKCLKEGCNMLMPGPDSMQGMICWKLQASYVCTSRLSRGASVPW
ncbi:glycosyl transferase [Tribonema minus]|uniref:Glycosyl transferase n=1 Tax=Tribonema minus TaxID=303371 RepID=A0A835Z8R4_9STRA|nr:glycosyl transferase [Tribonema minus]